MEYNICDYCKKKIDGLPHKCRYCKELHCSTHLLPESHDCEGLRQYKEKNAERWKKNFISGIKSENFDKSIKNIKENRHHHKKQDVFDKIKDYFEDKYQNIKDWLRKREHEKYDFKIKANYLIITLLIFIASIIGFSIFYSNAQKLNEINLWIIRLSGVLLLASLFFIIKYGLRIIKEIINLLKRQRNWLKYLIILIT